MRVTSLYQQQQQQLGRPLGASSSLPHRTTTRHPHPAPQPPRYLSPTLAPAWNSRPMPRLHAAPSDDAPSLYDSLGASLADALDAAAASLTPDTPLPPPAAATEPLTLTALSPPLPLPLPPALPFPPPPLSPPLPSSPGPFSSFTAPLSQPLHLFMDSFVAASPSALHPLLNTVAEDLDGWVTLSPSPASILRLLALYYLFLAKPSPLTGLLDFYIVGKLFSKMNNWSSKSFLLREKLGGGNFGTAFEGLQVQAGESVGSREPLSAEQKRRRVVLKRVNMDKGDEVRSNFLKSGTMAKGAAETGYVEAYMCDKISRHPQVAQCCAEFMGSFTPTESDGSFAKGTQWLVWKFESDSTLSDALDGQLGDFPSCLERFILGSVGDSVPTDKRESMVIKRILKQVLVALSRLHSIGIIHRDVKPENLLVTVDGQVKVIDFGAAVDLCTGINFNPLYGMLDPRYSPPEELVMPKSFPRYPAPFLAALLSPLAYLYGSPDLFDSYSAGILLVQMSVPQLRSTKASRLFNQELGQVDFDLQRWRDTRGPKYDFSLLDRNNKAGWDLATRLICRRDEINRGRISADQALSHRYFSAE